MLDNMFNKNKVDYELDKIGINNLRGLTIDMIQKANSGHPGICLGAAGIVYVLFKRHLILDLEDDKFLNRDRFILSAGHGAPLLYGLLYLMGSLTLNDLKKLRKINSKTPGHPEYLKTPFVEISTGPLGQGVGSSVGFSIAEAYLNKLTNGVIDHYTYVLCGDGELEEGITYEALSLAGTLNLNKLIVLYDSNNVTLDNKLEVTSHEDIVKRFESIGFLILEANDNPIEIDEALKKAKNSLKPSIILFKTTIGLYSKNAGTNLVHGKPLDEDDIFQIKEKLGLYNSAFNVNQDVLEDFRENIKTRFKEYKKVFNKNILKEKDNEIVKRLINSELTYNLNNLDINYNHKSLRDLSGEILNKIANDFPLLIGGSADLSSSCKTNLENIEIFSANNYLGRNIYFGIREHAMASILNGLALSGLRPFGSTFLTFSDYMKPSIRLTALMNLPVLYIFTHDSFTVGEDGPTHHPIEQLLSLELIPNLKVYRPYDLNELIGAYQEIFKQTNPSVLVLPRDNKDISEKTKIDCIKLGIYLVQDTKEEKYINLIANGEELGLALKVSDNLKSLGIFTKVYSAVCLKNADLKTINNLKKDLTIGITFGVPDYFYKITDKVIGLNEFSLSGSKEELLEYFGFIVEDIESKILEIINQENSY